MNIVSLYKKELSDILITRENICEFLKNNSIEEIIRVNPPISFDNNNRKVVSNWDSQCWDFSKDKIKHRAYSSIIDWEVYKDLNSTYLNELKYLSLLIYYAKYRNYKHSYEFQKRVRNLYPLFIASQSLNHSTICELNDDLKFIDILEKMKGKYAFRTLEMILNDLRTVSDINKKYFDLNINFGLKQARQVKSGFSLKELAMKYSSNQTDSVNQTPYIPSKLHSKLIANCIEVVHNKRRNLQNIMDFLEEDYLLYEKIKADLNLTDVSSGNSKKKIRRRKLRQTSDLFKKYELPFSTLHEVQKEVRLLASACVILILNFSGMRINELCNIQLDGFKVVNTEPELYVIRSYETKISGGQVVDYVTSPIVKDTFEILTLIHSLARKYDNSVSQTDLIISSKHQKLLTYGPSNLNSHMSNFANEINMVIDHDDAKESELLNGPREDIKVGNIWPLASHQFRRTLIVNFVSHRLGTINAVKQQVKHMYATMTEYYAKNSRLAETFELKVVQDVADNIEEELLNEGVRRYKQFYYSNEPLAGLKGEEIMEERKIAKVLSDKEIKQLFKTGLYKISKSMYGYCTKGNLCDKKEAIDPTFCGASCNTMIITKENAVNWQKLYFRNKKLLETSNDLIVSGIPMSAVKTTMQSQNEIAKKIMNNFNMKFED